MQIGRRSSLLSSEANPETIIDNSTIESLVKDLQPLIHYTALFIRLIHWKDNKKLKHSFALLLSLIIWWSIDLCVLYLLPLILVVAILQHETIFPSTRKSTQVDETNELIHDLTEIRDTVCLLASIKAWVQKSDTLCRAYYRYYSVATSKQRSMIGFGATIVLTFTYAGWMLLIHQHMITGCASLMWLLIVSIMCLYSPWTNPICVACVRAVTPLVYSWKVTEKDEQSARQPTDLVSAYCFQVYHHQRWWFPTGWSNFLLPEDPPVWSDQHGKPIPKLHDFTLPPDTYIGPPNEMNQQRCVSWVWMDPFWSKQKDVVGDKQSWQYGSKWKNWSSDANGSGFYTRRRKWFRYAQRKETWVSVDNSDCVSMTNGSHTTDTSSVCDWNDTPPISPSTSSSSISESVNVKPVLLSNNNVRRSSVPVTFKIPALSCSRKTVNPSQITKR